MQKIVFELPLNSLSYGNVSLNILREAFRIRNSLNVSIFPIAGKIDIESFDKLDEEFKDYSPDKDDSYFGIKTGILVPHPSFSLLNPMWYK